MLVQREKMRDSQTAQMLPAQGLFGGWMQKFQKVTFSISFGVPPKEKHWRMFKGSQKGF